MNISCPLNTKMCLLSLSLRSSHDSEIVSSHRIPKDNHLDYAARLPTVLFSFIFLESLVAH